MASALPLVLDIDQVATVLRCSESTVTRLLRAGTLPSVTIGRRRRLVRGVDLAAYIEQLPVTSPEGARLHAA